MDGADTAQQLTFLLSPGSENTGDAGNVNIEAGNLTFTGGAQIATNTFGGGRGGTITISGQGNTGTARLLSTVPTLLMLSQSPITAAVFLE